MLGNTGYAALLLAERMGWDPIQDISIMINGNNIDALREGRVDAFVASERSYSIALQQGFPVLAATSEWGETMAGNSVYVKPEWLENQGIARLLAASCRLLSRESRCFIKTAIWFWRYSQSGMASRIGRMPK